MVLWTRLSALKFPGSCDLSLTMMGGFGGYAVSYATVRRSNRILERMSKLSVCISNLPVFVPENILPLIDGPSEILRIDMGYLDNKASNIAKTLDLSIMKNIHTCREIPFHKSKQHHPCIHAFSVSRDALKRL